MRKLLKLFHICLISCLLFSCKLILIADSGGSIVSASSSNNCSDQCTIDVAGNFDEIFTAKADSGYAFAGWAQDGLCAESLDNECAVLIPAIFAELFPFDLTVHAVFVAVINVAGIWDLVQYVDETNCGEGTSVDTKAVEIAIDGNEISIFYSGFVFKDTLTDRTLSVDLIYPEDGGTITSKLTVTFSEDFMTLSGTVTWSWTDGTNSCSGIDDIEGAKQ